VVLGGTLEGPLDAVDLDEIDADAEDPRAHRRGHSTVTVFARLRGWSTLSPRARATA
jgi:hypothetical protein